MNEDEREDPGERDISDDMVRGEVVEDEWSAGGGDAPWTIAPERRTDPAALVAALVVGAVTALLLVLIWDQFSESDTDGSANARGGPTAAIAPLFDDDAVLEGAGEHHATRLSRCVNGDQLLQQPLDAAQASLDQWSVHVGAMNKLVVGAITLKQATDFWSDTRVGARQRLEDFDRAVDELSRRGIDCPDPDLLAPGAQALPSCARAVQAKASALRAARVSISTWAEHVHHMEMLRLGQMTPQQATRMWLESWRQGVRELDYYDVAMRATRRQDGCAGAAAAR